MERRPQPESEMGQPITFMACTLTDDLVALSLGAEGPEVQGQALLDVALQERLAGPRCERCQEDTDTGLRLCGGEALCDDCVGVEFLGADPFFETSTSP